MEDFKQRVERFFKQFRSCLGIEPNLRAHYLERKGVQLFEDDDTLYHHIVESPRLPLDYTYEDKIEMGEEHKYTPLTQPYDSLVEELEVDLEYIIEAEIIEIDLSMKKAIKDDGLKFENGLIFIEAFKKKYWGDDKFPYEKGEIIFPEEIFDDICKWLASKMPVSSDIDSNAGITTEILMGELRNKRLDIYNRLLDTLKGNTLTQPKSDPSIIELGHEKFRKAFKEGEEWDFLKDHIPGLGKVLPAKSKKVSDNESTSQVQDNFSFTNNFDHVETDVIYEHFKKGLVDPGYLSLEKLDKYLKLAFESLEQPKEDKFWFSDLYVVK